MGLTFDFLLPHPDPDRKRTGIGLYFYRLWCHLGQLSSANLLFLLFSIPGVTIPASYTALCKVSVLIVRNEPVHVWEDFFGTFRSCFKASLGVGLATLSAPVLAFYAVPFYRTYCEDSLLFAVPLAVVVLVTVFQVLMGYYAYPMLSSVDMKAGTVIRNSALLALAKLPQNLLTLLIQAALWFVAILFLPLSLIAVVFILFSMVALATVSRVWETIDTYVVRKE